MENASTTRPVRGEARDAILQVAERLFYRYGINAVGVDTLAKEAGITKRTLYYHFPNKEAVLAAYLQQHDALNFRPLTEEAGLFGPLPGDHVLGLFEAFSARFEGPQYRGCAFLNAVVEGGDSLPSVRDCVTMHKDAMLNWITKKLLEANASEAQMLAQQLMLLLDGALIRVLIYPGSEVVRNAQLAAATLINVAGVPLTPAKM